MANGSAKADAFVNQQWLWFNAAAMASAIVGGQLVQWLPPATALAHRRLHCRGSRRRQCAAGATLLLVPEERATRLRRRRAPQHNWWPRRGFSKRRELWIIGLFLFLYYFSPGSATPLYYAMTGQLEIPARLYRHSAGSGSLLAGCRIAGALLYPKLFENMSSKRLLNLSIALGTVTTAAYLLPCRRDVGSHSEFLQRLFGDAGDRGDGHARRRLLSATNRGI